ncbi:MAG: DNA-directed RNA polymerase subunit omega [Victivallaceae bacterium]|nr:DNA-directed RNA polymerase subunit omega [Victivallaceae bacterium]
MNNAYLERAKLVITDPKILSIITAKRARELALGARPMVKCKSENWLDVALLEIAEGKLFYEFSDTPEEDIFADAMSNPESDSEATPAKTAKAKVAKKDIFGTDQNEQESAEVLADEKEDSASSEK